MKGDIFINGISVVQHPRGARLSLGVCPQFTAIDGQLTVREHLLLYGRLKGIPRGPELNQNVDTLLRATTLAEYTDRLASQLSGGNQRKLALAIAMIGSSRSSTLMRKILKVFSVYREPHEPAYR